MLVQFTYWLYSKIYIPHKLYTYIDGKSLQIQKRYVIQVN